MEATVTDSLRSLSAVDISFFVLALAISVIIGIYFANKNATLEDYMLGGRDQRLLPVSLSMMTSFISGLTLIGNPAEFYHHGPYYALFPLAQLLSVPFSALILMPVFYRLNNLSIFNYLEQRYSRALKRVVSLVFIVQMTLYNAAVLFVPSLSLQSILGISDLVSIGAVGASCLLYSTLGGIKAVIWTDFFQAILMYFAMLCICVGGTLEAGGFWRLIEINRQGHHLDTDQMLTFDLSTRHTLFTVATGATLINVFMNGANQIQVQRALSLPNVRLAQWSQLATALFTALISLICTYVGLIIFSAFRDCDPFAAGQIDKRDAIVIYYISTHLTYIPGLRGVFVAGIFAATLSTLSSFQNSMSALLMEDFIKPALSSKLSDRAETKLSKLLAFCFGLACILLTFVVGKVAGLLQVVYTLFGALGAPFICAFFMGMLTRYANSVGMMAGMLAGFALGIYVQFYQTFWLPPLEPSAPLSVAGCPATDHLLTLLAPGQPQVSQLSEQASALAKLGNMSYLWLPVAALALSFVVSSAVSLLTGGWRQKVEDKYLVAYLHLGDGSAQVSGHCSAEHEGCYRSQKDELVGQIKSCIRDLEAEQERRRRSFGSKQV